MIFRDSREEGNFWEKNTRPTRSEPFSAEGMPEERKEKGRAGVGQDQPGRSEQVGEQKLRTEIRRAPCLNQFAADPGV